MKNHNKWIFTLGIILFTTNIQAQIKVDTLLTRSTNTKKTFRQRQDGNTGTISGTITEKDYVAMVLDNPNKYGANCGCFSLQLIEAIMPPKSTGTFTKTDFDINSSFDGYKNIRLTISDKKYNSNQSYYEYKFENVPLYKNLFIMLYYTKNDEEHGTDITATTRLEVKGAIYKRPISLKEFGLVNGVAGSNINNNITIDVYMQPAVH